jgi:hypothetical protein
MAMTLFVGCTTVDSKEVCQMKEIVAALMIWIAEHTGYVMPDPPKIAQMSNDALREEFCMLNSPTVEKHNDCLSKAFDVNAFYDLYRGTISIPLNWDANNMLHVETLLHELVHHFQAHNNVTEDPNCPGNVEKEAYMLGRYWLQQQGADEEMHLVHNIMIRLADACGFSL